ncbi:hypothetical protein [Thiomicrorhabdus hydrogeniphila]
MSEVVNCLLQVYVDSLRHDGFADIRVEIKILKRGQKEIIIHSGKQYRYVIDLPKSMADLQVEDFFEGYELIASSELERLKQGQAKSFSLARTGRF